MGTRVTLILSGIAVLSGLVGGPWALDVAAQSRPPLRWSDLGFIGIGTGLGVFLVVGLQAVLGNALAVRTAWRFFFLAALHFFGLGVSAAVAGLTSQLFEPSSFLFLVMGISCIIGVAALRLVFARRITSNAT